MQAESSPQVSDDGYTNPLTAAPARYPFKNLHGCRHALTLNP